MNPSFKPDGVLSALRAATSAAHLQMEQAVQIEKQVTAQPSYVRLLQSFCGFYRPLEVRLFRLDGWREAGLDLTVRRKTPWLEADLSALGMTAPQIDQMQDCARLPPTHTLAQGFGCLYVLEGATLGGRQIRSLMQASPVPMEARHFFGSYGPEVGPRWVEFTSAMEEYARKSGAGASTEMAQGAQETFACLQRWIVEHCPPDDCLG